MISSKLKMNYWLDGTKCSNRKSFVLYCVSFFYNLSSNTIPSPVIDFFPQRFGAVFRAGYYPIP